MKRLFGVVIAAGLWSGAALAQDAQGSVNTDTGEVQGSVQTEQDETSTSVQTSDDSFSGTVQSDDPAYGGSGQAGTTNTSDTYVGAVNVDADDEAQREEEDDMRGLVVTLGGGVEGYTGALRRQLEPGAAWGVAASIKPTKVLGLEFGYSGAANELGNDGLLDDANEGANGADVVRNGGYAAATVGLSATPVQPYLLGGVGLNRYTVRADNAAFRDDTSGNIPVGLGVRAHIGQFTADLRGTYSVLFADTFARNPGGTEEVAGESFLEAGRWNGTLNIGTTW